MWMLIWLQGITAILPFSFMVLRKVFTKVLMQNAQPYPYARGFHASANTKACSKSVAAPVR